MKIILKPYFGIDTQNIELILERTERNNGNLIDILIKRMNVLESEQKLLEESTKKDIDSLRKENDDLKNKLILNEESTKESINSLKRVNEDLKRQLKECDK